jgi:hypothetical protein
LTSTFESSKSPVQVDLGPNIHRSAQPFTEAGSEPYQKKARRVRDLEDVVAGLRDLLRFYRQELRARQAYVQKNSGIPNSRRAKVVSLAAHAELVRQVPQPSFGSAPFSGRRSGPRQDGQMAKQPTLTSRQSPRLSGEILAFTPQQRSHLSLGATKRGTTRPRRSETQAGLCTSRPKKMPTDAAERASPLGRILRFGC